MRKIMIVIVMLLLSSSAQTKSSPCYLTPEQLQQFSSTMPSVVTCDQYTLNMVLPAQRAGSVYTLPIQFDSFEDNFTFSGLAKYYSGSRPVSTNDWVGWKARYLTLLVNAENADVIRADNGFNIVSTGDLPVVMNVYMGPAVGAFSAVQYSYLWSWMATICEVIESGFIKLGGILNNAWGISIIALAIIFKFIFLPLQLWVQKLQREMDRCELILKPKLKSIKEQFDGEEAHHLIMAEYKQLGITPFYGMKPLIGPLIQLPIQIAIFNVLGEMPELAGASFWWIDDLAYPDIGLPILMMTVSLISTYFMQKSTGKYHLYLMAVVFFILFYPFPAAMVLFWTSMNVLHLLSSVWSNFWAAPHTTLSSS